jgi:hypothetical protein
MFRLLFSIFRLLVFPARLKELALENLALRQQLTVMKRQCPRPRLRTLDRWFLGLPLANLAELAKASAFGETGDRDRLASARISPLPVVDFQAETTRSAGKGA